MRNDQVYIIAEAGVNHNGSLKLAKRMIRVAAEAGVNAVKFQTFRADNLVTRQAAKADYQLQTTAFAETQYDMLKMLELDEAAHRELICVCKNCNMEFLSTAFDFPSIDLLMRLGMNVWKIPSGEITNLPYLMRIGALMQKVILSTGMSTIDEVAAACNVLVNHGTLRENITLLHCTTEYPALFEDVNLNAMRRMRDEFDMPVGYSDHTLGIEVPIAAVAMGASVIEKHFTLDRSLPGPDHQASLEPEELKAMVKAIRNIEKAMGNGIKQPTPSELRNKLVARKSIVASANISKGEKFTENNLAVKRPGTGLSPMLWDEIIGQTAKKNYLKDDLIDA